MKGIHFRRGLVLAGIKSGLDLGAAVAAAKEAEAWCAAGGDEDVFMGGAMPEPLPLPPPGRPPAGAGEKDSPRRHEGTKPGRAKRARRPAKKRKGRLETVPGAARPNAQRSRHAQGDPAGAAPSLARSARRDRGAALLRAIADAGAEGLSIAALVDAGVGSKVTVTRLLNAALAAGTVVRAGPQRGRGVVWIPRRNGRATSPPAVENAPPPALTPAQAGGLTEKPPAASPDAAPAPGAASWPWRQVSAALLAAGGAGMSRSAIASRTGLEGPALDDGITHCVRKGLAVERDRVFFARGYQGRAGAEA